MIDTILFDYDGTIMDTNDLVIASWQHTFKEMGEPVRPLDEITSHFGEPIMDIIRFFFPDEDPDYVVGIYRSFHNSNFRERTCLFPGVMEVLEEFHSRGYPMAIVTNRVRYSTELGLDKYGILPMFGAVVCEGDAQRAKPFPDSIYLALEQLGSSVDRAVLIGDSQNDILCGRNAGVLTVRVAWAVATDEKYDGVAAEPDHTIDKPADLIKLLDELNR